MVNRIHSVTFTLIAVIDGKDSLSLDASPSAVIWNQEGDVTADDDGTVHDNSSWPAMYVVANVKKGGEYDNGWTFDYSLSGCSMTVKKGLFIAGVFTELNMGGVFELSDPKKNKDANGKEASGLWTNGTLRITATKQGEQQLRKDVPIALNALATWKLSVYNGTMSAVSQRTETQVDGKLKTYETRLTQNENNINSKVSQTDYNRDRDTINTKFSEIDQRADRLSLRVSSQRSGRNMWVDGDFEMSRSVAPKYAHNTAGGTKVSDGINPYDMLAGFNNRLVFDCPAANYGIYYKGTQPHLNLKKDTTYCLSFYAKITAEGVSCMMDTGIENIKKQSVSLNSEWQRFAIYITPTADVEAKDVTVVFYPTAALKDSKGNAAYVCMTGIQFEVGNADSGAPTVWSKSTYDILQTTGIDIEQGIINAIAGMFNFVGRDGKPFIRVEQDSDGYPHLIFYNPKKTDNAGNPMPAYDLGYSGIKQIIGTGELQSWYGVRYQYTFAAKATTNPCDFYRQMMGMGYREAYQYRGGYYNNATFGKVWLPAEAENYDGLYYDTMTKDSDDLPTGNLLADGWHVYSTKYESQRFNMGTVNYPSYGYYYQYTYEMFYTQAGKRKKTTHKVTVRYTDAREIQPGMEYGLWFDDDSSTTVNGRNTVTFPPEPTE